MQQCLGSNVSECGRVLLLQTPREQSYQLI